MAAKLQVTARFLKVDDGNPRVLYDVGPKTKGEELVELVKSSFNNHLNMKEISLFINPDREFDLQKTMEELGVTDGDCFVVVEKPEPRTPKPLIKMPVNFDFTKLEYKKHNKSWKNCAGKIKDEDQLIGLIKRNTLKNSALQFKLPFFFNAKERDATFEVIRNNIVAAGITVQCDDSSIIVPVCLGVAAGSLGACVGAGIFMCATVAISGSTVAGLCTGPAAPVALPCLVVGGLIVGVVVGVAVGYLAHRHNKTILKLTLNKRIITVVS